MAGEEFHVVLLAWLRRRLNSQHRYPQIGGGVFESISGYRTPAGGPVAVARRGWHYRTVEFGGAVGAISPVRSGAGGGDSRVLFPLWVAAAGVDPTGKMYDFSIDIQIKNRPPIVSFESNFWSRLKFSGCFIYIFYFYDLYQ